MNFGLKRHAPCIYFKAMAKGGVFMKRANDSPQKVKVNVSSRKKDDVSSSVLRKAIFDTNYYYYYFTEVQQQK